MWALTEARSAPLAGGPRTANRSRTCWNSARAALPGRCLYPFLHARVSFSGKVYFCPFIRVEVGDLAHSSLEEIWNGVLALTAQFGMPDWGGLIALRWACDHPGSVAAMVLKQLALTFTRNGPR